MENLTNFDMFLYTYLFLTLTTILYPIQLWFRVNFINFIFMLFEGSFLLISKLNIVLIFNKDYFFSTGNINLLIIIMAIFIIISIYFRASNNIVRLDSLLLGFFPFLVFFDIIYLFLFGYSKTVDLYLIVPIFIMFYAIFIQTKLEYTIPIVIKEMNQKIN